MAEDKKHELAVKLDSEVLSVIGADRLGGFQDAFKIAEAIGKLKEMLTTDYMKPIMQLQGNQLGFKTDKDNANGYPESVVKNCLIEAVLMGVQPWGNQFNIIAGNSYITKAGFGFLLKKQPGLTYEIIPGVPSIDLSKKTGAVDMDISWTLNGKKENRKLPITVKVNEYMGVDAVIGKATRKARCWLFNTINDVEIMDADAEEINAEVVEIKEEQYDWNELTSLYNIKKGLMNEKQQKSSERIITGKEKTGYKKLMDFLIELKPQE